jgi:hypothetical protein
MNVNRIAHDPSARFAGTSPRKTRGGKSVASSDKAGAAGRSRPGSAVVGATSTASADSFFMFSSPDLVGWSARNNEATGNPFHERTFL